MNKPFSALPALFWLAIALMFLVFAFAGCTVPPVAPTPEPEHKPMFSVTPVRMSEHQRKVMQMVDLLSPPESAPYRPGNPVFVKFPLVNQEAEAKVKLAVKLAVHTNRLLVLDLDGLGGRVYIAFNISSIINDAVDSQGLAVNCIVKNEADSAHAFLFEMVHCRRALYKETKLVFHHPAVDYNPADTTADLVRKASVEEDLAHALCSMVSERSKGNVSPEVCHFQLHANDRRTWTIQGSDAVGLGLADYTLDLK